MIQHYNTKDTFILKSIIALIFFNTVSQSVFGGGAITLSNPSGAPTVSAQTYVAGSTGDLIFGFGISKSTGSPDNITKFRINLDKDPNILFPAASGVTIKKNGSTISSSYVFGGSGPWFIDITLSSAQSVTPSTDEYRIFVNVNAGVLSSNGPVVASLGNGDVSFSAGGNTASGGTITGPSIAFSALVATATTNNGGISSPLTAGVTNTPIFGFSATSNGTQSVNNVVMTITTTASTLSTILTNIKLKDDGPNSTYSGGGTSYSASAPVSSGSGPFVYTITFTPSSPLSASAKYFYVVADIPGTAPATTNVQVDITTVGVDQGATSTLTGFTETFNITTPSATITQNNGGLASTLTGGTTNTPLFGFSAVTNGSQTINNVVVKITTSASSLSSILTNIKLKDDGTNSTYSGGGTAYTAGAPVSSGSGPFVYTITFTPTSPLTSSSEYFYVVADIPGTAPSTSGIQFDVNTIGVDAGSVSSLTGFSRTFNITALTATLAQNNGALPATVGAGTTNAPLFGFSAVSSGSQTLNNVVVTITTTAPTLSSILTNIKLKDDGTNSTYSGGGTSYAAGAPVSSGSGPFTYTITFTPSSTLPVSPATSKYFYVVADIPATAIATPGIQIDVTTIAANQGTVSPVTGYTRNFDITLAQTSTITVNYVGQNSIDIGEYSNQASSGLTVGNSQRIFAIDITDADADVQGTTITSLTLQFTGTAITNLNAIALFDAGSSTEITNSEKTVSTSINGSNQIVFSGISIPVSDGSSGTPSVKTIDIRVTFKTAVVDNDQIPVSVAGATASALGSGLAPIGSVSTGSGKNPINVVATEMRFSNISNPINPNQNFGLTVSATDANGNVDKDENGSVTLSMISGTGTFTVSDTPSSRSFSAGTTSWSQLKITTANSKTLRASESGGSSLTHVDQVISVTSLGVNVTPGNTGVTLCYNGVYQTLSSITLTESDPADFAAGTNQTFSLLLPSGFVFNTAATIIKPTVSGNEISNASFVSYPTSNVVRFSYDVSGTTNSTLDQIVISGLQIKYTGSNPTASGSILRFGGSAIQVGNSDTDNKIHGILNANITNTSVTPTFTVQELSGNPSVPPTQTSFDVTSKPVKLIGSPSGGVFTGSAVILSATNGYIFDPTVVGVGTYPITYSMTDPGGQQCQINVTTNFDVTTTWITGLLSSYCSTSPPSTSLSVSQAVIDQQKSPLAPGTYDFVEFVYWEPTTNSFTTIPPTNSTFDPSDAVYQKTVSVYGGVWIGYRAKNHVTGVVLPDGPGNFVNINYLFVPVVTAPVLTFNLPASVCVNATPIDLDNLVSPQPSTPATDNFTATSAVSSPSTNQWIFTPSSVPGASSSPQSVIVTYHYKSGSCSNSISKSIVVNPVPSTISPATISPGTTANVCQGSTTPVTFTTPTSSIIYNWYNSNPPTTYITSGNSFTASSVNTASPGTTNFSVTQTVNGCESPALALQVVVNATPSTPGSSFSRSYCVMNSIPNSDFSVGGSNLTWINATTNTVLTIANPNNPTTSELGISNTVAGKYGYIVTQTVSGCASQPISVTATVNALPNVNIAVAGDQTKICKTGALLSLSGSPVGGAWSGSGSFALINNNVAQGTADLNPSQLTAGSVYNMRYDYTDPATTCASYDTINNFEVLPSVIPSLSIGPSCNGFYTDILNTSAITPFSSSSTIDSIAWSFGDNSSLPERKYTATIPNGFSDLTIGTFKNPKHKYKQIALVPITYKMTTSDGCTITGTQQINIREVPKADFSWSNPCFDPSTHTSSTQFTAYNLNGNMPPSEIQTYTWDFHAASVLNYSSASTGKTPVVNYTNYGRDSVQLILTSTHNCKDTIQKPIFIVPSYPPITELNSYSQNFNTGNDGWIDGGTRSSWQLGKPAAPIINRDSSATGNGNAWVTNLTGNSNAKEQSWVISPCFDFTQTQKPVISLDIWSETLKRLDGAVLEYNTTGNIENDANWNAVGQVGLGVNWYDQTGISSKPGNQSPTDGDTGWTGDASGGKYTTWKHAIFRLDNLIGQNNVLFRIAFASGLGTHEGFGFDNIFIGERSRSVLVENFTNTSAAANAKTQNQAFNAFQNASSEVVKVQYHTAFPGYDTLNKSNAGMNSARAAFYGITTAPSLRVDGNYGTDPNWFAQLYDEEVLSPSPLKIAVTTAKVGEVVKINASITNTTNTALPLKDTHLFVVVVEKSITTSPWLGNDGDLQFKYVAKEMLPSPAGIVLPDQLTPGQVFQAPELVWQNNNLITPNNSGIVVFVQGIGNDKQVQQAKYFDNGGVEPSIVTAVEPSLTDQIRLYPNPADQSVTLHLASPVHDEAPLKMFDINGNEVYHGIMEKGQQVKTITTENLTSGVYLLQLNSGSVVRRKVMILHP